MLTDSELCQPVSTDTDVEQLFDTYDAVLRKVADDLAPVHIIRSRHGRLAPWFDTECRSLRQESRRLERQYRRTYTAEHRRLWVDATRRRLQVYRSKKEQHWLERVQSSQGSSFQLWRSLSTLLVAIVILPALPAIPQKSLPSSSLGKLKTFVHRQPAFRQR